MLHYFKMGTRGCKKWSRSEKGKIFYSWQLFVYINVFSGNLLSQLVCYICMHVTYVPTDFLVTSHWTCHACVMYITHQLCVTYVTNLWWVWLLCFVTYVTHIHFCRCLLNIVTYVTKDNIQNASGKNYDREVSKFVCDMTNCYIPDWHSYLQLSWSNCFVTHAAEANVWNASQKQLCQKR